MLNLPKNPNHWFIESYPEIGAIYKDNIFGDYWQCIGYSTVDGTKFEFLYILFYLFCLLLYKIVIIFKI